MRRRLTPRTGRSNAGPLDAAPNGHRAERRRPGGGAERPARAPDQEVADSGVGCRRGGRWSPAASVPASRHPGYHGMQSGVRRWAVAVDVYARIRDDIVSGALAPGLSTGRGGDRAAVRSSAAGRSGGAAPAGAGRPRRARRARDAGARAQLRGDPRDLRRADRAGGHGGPLGGRTAHAARPRAAPPRPRAHVRDRPDGRRGDGGGEPAFPRDALAGRAQRHAGGSPAPPCTPT